MAEEIEMLIKLIWGKCKWNGNLAQFNGLGAQGLVHFSCINNYNVCMIPLNCGYGVWSVYTVYDNKQPTINHQPKIDYKMKSFGKWCRIWKYCAFLVFMHRAYFINFILKCCLVMPMPIHCLMNLLNLL